MSFAACVPLFLFLSAAAMAMYFVAGVQYLELVFDHYYRFIGLGIALFGVALGLAMVEAKKDTGRGLLVKTSPLLAMGIAVTVQLVSGYAAVHFIYGAGWVFLLLVLLLVLPYLFWVYACSLLRAGSPSPYTDKVSLVTGAGAGLFVSPWFITHADHLSVLWLVSSALMTFSVLPVFIGRRRPIAGGLVLCFAVAMAWLASSNRMDGYPRWDASYGSVTKPVAMALANQNELGIQTTDWLSGLRIDNIIASNGGKDAFGWSVVNGTAPVPLIEDAKHKLYPWWVRRFPLMILPIETVEPETMLSIEPFRGPGAYIAALQEVGEYESLNYAENACARVSDLRCFSAVTDRVLSADKYDLIHLSVSHPLMTGWVGANTQDEYLVSKQLLERYLSLLDYRGVLAITVREEAIFMKLLVSVLTQMLPELYSNVMSMGDRLRVFRLGQSAPYKGNYRFLIMASRNGFSSEQMVRMGRSESRLPVEKLVYDNQVHSTPYGIFDNPRPPLSLLEVQQHFSRYVGSRLQSTVRLLEPSSLERPDFFRLSAHTHGSLVWLLTAVVGVLIYAVLFSFPDRRDFESAYHLVQPALAVFLVQLAASAAASGLVLNAVLQPAVIALQIPQQGFLWMVSLLVVMLVATARRETLYTQGVDDQLSLVSLVGMALILLALYFSVNTFTQFLQLGRLVVLLPLVSLIFLAAGWMAWSMHQAAMLQLRRFYELPLSWGWLVSGLSVLAATIVSTQIGWSAAIRYAAALYGVVFLVNLWVVVGCLRNSSGNGHRMIG